LRAFISNCAHFDAQIDLFKANTETRRKNYKITKNRFDKGLITYLDVTQAEVELANVEASYLDAVRLRMLTENQIATLTGEIASDFCIEHRPLESPPPIIPAGIPSQVLLQRPDIAQAERTMASEHALINAAYASFFPSLSLTAAFGFQSPDLKRFLSWISRYWMVGINGSQMIFDGGRDCYLLKEAWARFLEASGAYQEQVLVAFQEVEDALSNIEWQQKQSEQLYLAAQASKKATLLSMNRYLKGVAIYLEVADSERSKLEAEIQWIRVLEQRYVSTVQLIKALGGTWELGDEKDCFIPDVCETAMLRTSE
jgi:multidrug efflux system outer membrane protein